MDNPESSLARKNILGWALLAGGIILFAIGVVIKLAFPVSAVNYRLVMTFGVFFAGWAVIHLAGLLAALQDSEAARRRLIEEQDERSRSLRHRAGYTAFTFTMLVSCAVLLIYSSASWKAVPASDFDPLWFYLAFMVLAPGLVYVISLVRYHSKY